MCVCLFVDAMCVLSSRLSCPLLEQDAHSMEESASFESSLRLSCALPVWGSMFTATSLILKVRGDQALIEKRTVGLQYIAVYESWLSQDSFIGDAAGGTEIHLKARGLIVDLASRPYVCIFSDSLGGVEVAVAVSPLSPSELVCITPAWGRQHTAAQTFLSVHNRVRDLVVQYEGQAGLNTFDFTASWACVQEQHLAASGGELSIIASGLRILSPYRCLLESNETQRMVSNLARPTSSSTVFCSIPAWGQFHDSTIVNVTLLDGYGLEVFFSGVAMLKQVEIRETWLSVKPTLFKSNSHFTVTVVGFGFNLRRLYKCNVSYRAMGFWDTLYKPDKWSPGAAESWVEEVSSLEASSPVDCQTLICSLSPWGSSYAARNATFTVYSFGQPVSREILFVGKELERNIRLDPTWESIRPARYGWVGLGAITGYLFAFFSTLSQQEPSDGPTKSNFWTVD